MTYAQRELFPSSQADLFGDDAPMRPTYQVKREHVLNRLVEMLGDMRGAKRWPWSETRVSLNRETVWPYLLRLLPEPEAARWREELDAEAGRLDAAG
ncbi:hypothetical protein IHQ68_12695 [Chelatococcus sambhunathii]|uniref:Uncharacterized protein n=1 Tax=Chelatococcus sambhunathii TaxID=363953 RepID=A0ABU1DHD2_9HYPH|nr:hypothetical protein [Chelatococcus sambhunathii]MDR4307476.1 hypothetical protein [Chelatococcus sambhunathii]